MYACYKNTEKGLQKLSYLYNRKDDAIRYVETLNTKDLQNKMD